MINFISLQRTFFSLSQKSKYIIQITLKTEGLYTKCIESKEFNLFCHHLKAL